MLILYQYKGDTDGLRAAIESAIANLFPPYIREPSPPLITFHSLQLAYFFLSAEGMKRENVEKRLLELVYRNWTQEAYKLINDGDAKEFANPRTGENVR